MFNNSVHETILCIAAERAGKGLFLLGLLNETVFCTCVFTAICHMRLDTEFSTCSVSVGNQRVLDLGAFWIFGLKMLNLFLFKPNL